MAKQALHKTFVSTFVAMSFALLAGCATATLKPAPSAQVAQGDESQAIGRSDGVQLTIDTDAWSSYPQALENRLTPVRATIVNSSEHPVEIKYEHFSLSGFDGVTYHPLPPIDIKGSVSQVSRYPVYAPRFAYHRYVVAPFYYPYYDPYFAGLHRWVYRPWEPWYYARYYPRWSVDLPTRDMIELAIPEGVIEPHGQVSGFLYFPKLDAANEGDQIKLTANLVDATQNDAFGRITIPMVME
jgi:hypothetical protein